MTKKIISLYIEESTLEKIDTLAKAFDGNRSLFIEWLSNFDFFIEKGKLEQIKRITELKGIIAKEKERPPRD